METVMSAPPKNEVILAEATPMDLARPTPGVIAAVFHDYLCARQALPVIPRLVQNQLGYRNGIVRL